VIERIPGKTLYSRLGELPLRFEEAAAIAAKIAAALADLHRQNVIQGRRNSSCSRSGNRQTGSISRQRSTISCSQGRGRGVMHRDRGPTAPAGAAPAEPAGWGGLNHHFPILGLAAPSITKY
jgi:serine/threonine protein kinase